MSLGSTSDRYNYIYGNTVRKLEIPSAQPGPAAESRGPERAGIYPAGQIYTTSSTRSDRQARRQRKAERALDFDWKYTVILTVAAFIFMASAIFNIKGTITLHNLNGQITELKEEKTRLLGKQTALKSEIDKATNLDEIRDYAVKKLKMVYPSGDRIIYFKDNNDDYIRQYESVHAGR